MADIDAMMSEQIAGLSLKELRGLIAESGLTADGCIDKSDLRARAREGLERLKQPGARTGPISKPLVSALVAEELGLFKEPPTEEELAKEAAEKEATEKETAEKAAAERAALEKEVMEREAALKEKERQAAEEKRRAEEEKKKAKREAEEAEKKAIRDAKRKAAAEVAATKEAAAQEATKLLDAVTAGDVAQLKELLQTINPDRQGEEGNTPLHVACRKGLLEIATALVDAGANPNATNDDGQCPLHLAAMFNRIEVANFLLSKGANALTKDSTSQSARGYAALNNREEMRALLTEAEATATTRQAADAQAAAQAAVEAKAQAEQVALATALVGKQVRISGLKARPEVNGLLGYVLNMTPAARCTVAVKMGEEVEQMALKPANLTAQD